MATKIRLQRHGKKNYAFFHIVVADSRAKRDGRFIQKLGTYNPNTNPATIDIDFDAALNWVKKGAQPTDTTRAILSYKGVLMKKHLLDGVKKGALTEEQAEEKFAKWMEEKNNKIKGKRENLGKSAAEQAAKKLEAEAEVSKKRQEALAAKQAEAEAANAEAEEAPAEEAAAESEENNEEKAG